MGLYISLVSIVTNSKAGNCGKEKSIEKQIKKSSNNSTIRSSKIECGERELSIRFAPFKCCQNTIQKGCSHIT
jgi:hypothetical protein